MGVLLLWLLRSGSCYDPLQVRGLLLIMARLSCIWFILCIVGAEFCVLLFTFCQYSFGCLLPVLIQCIVFFYLPLYLTDMIKIA